MGQNLLEMSSEPPRFIAAVGSESTKITLEAQLPSVPTGTWKYVMAVGTRAVLEVPKDKRGQVILAEYGSKNLDLATIFDQLSLPFVLVSYGSERLADHHADIAKSSAVCGYHLNPTIKELRVSIANAHRFYLMLRRIKRDAEYIRNL